MRRRAGRGAPGAALLAAAVALAAAQPSAAAAAQPQRATAAAAPPPVVVVVFDELPTYSLMAADETVNAARFPSFARLAAEATWYRNATTVADNTHASLPAMLTGRRPGLVVPVSDGAERNLFALVRHSHRIRALEPITRLCPPGLCLHATAAALPPITGRSNALRRLRAALRLVRGIRRQDGPPPLFFVHVMAPHVPWQFLPSGHRYPIAGKKLPGIRADKSWGADGFRLRQAMQRHLLQVGFADRILGALMRRLRAAGLWDPALVVVTSDHGMSIRPRGMRRRVSVGSFADLAGVPLFVKRPGAGPGAVSDAPARTIDILPTIARSLGDPFGWAYDGVPLQEATGNRTLHVRNASLQSLVALPVDALAMQRAALVRQWTSTFPGGWGSVLSSGASHPMIGAAAPRPARARAGCGRAEIADGGFSRVNPRRGTLPVYVEGVVHRCRGRRRMLAVTVDERVRAVVRSYREDGAERFSALVPPSSMARGAHSVGVYEIGTGGSLRLLAARPARRSTG